MRFPLLASALALCASFSSGASAQPQGYYDSVDTTNATTLRNTLHAVIDDHTRFPYTSSSTDTWDILEIAQEDPNNASNVLDVYRNASYPKQGGGNSFYNREHTWPTSYGFPNDGSTNYPFSDCHQLYLCNDSYNSSRGNKPFRSCSAACTERITEVNNGEGGGSGVYPGNSNWTSGTGTSGTWEIWHDRRGDVARAMFYLDVRYEGGTHGGTGALEPDLILTDSEALIQSGNTGQNESIAYMGILSELIQWHLDDPVDAKEMLKNETVFLYQGNRNPFVDHPEWVTCLFESNCTGDSTPPAAPTGLVATAGLQSVSLDWFDNGEGDLAGYDVYRSTTSGGPYTQVNGSLVVTSDYVDTGLSGGTPYFYVVRAVDLSSNDSPDSAEATATPTGSGVADPWINEFHYDNSGADTGEFIEVAGPAGLDLSGWSLVGYNGNGGATYKTVALSGVLPDQGGCIGTLSFAFSGLQNGSPDGMALVDPSDNVIQFLSYEGVLTAVGGPANGMTSENVGVVESGTTAIGFSLQLGGTGSSYAGFTWQTPQTDTPGAVNAGQTFSGGCPPAPPAAPTGLAALPGDGDVLLTWNANSEGDLTGYDVYRSTTPMSGYTLLTPMLVTTTSFLDTTAVNGTTYFYVVTAWNTSGLESPTSAEVSATPMDAPPAAPVNLRSLGRRAGLRVRWDANAEADLAGYDLYRASVSGGPYAKVNVSPLLEPTFLDTGVAPFATVFYVVRAVDQGGGASVDSLQLEATYRVKKARGSF